MTADPLAPAAARLGMPSGSLYTLIVGAIVAFSLTMTGPTAAFSNGSSTSSANSGLGNLAIAPAAPTPTPTTTPLVAATTPTTVSSISPATAPPATLAPLPAPSPTSPPPTTVASAQPTGPQPGDLVTEARLPGRVTAVASVAGGVIVAIDRDDDDPTIVRLDLDGTEVGSVVVPGRDLSADTDIVDLDVDSFGRVIALVNGPAEVLRIEGSDVESLGVIGDLPPCALPLPVPIACEPGTEDHPVDVASVTVTSDGIVVSDPGQGALWLIDDDGAVTAARIDESMRATDGDEPSLGIRGIVPLPGGSVLGAVDESLVEFSFGPDEVTATSVRTLDASGLALARSSGGALFVLDANGDITHYDRNLSIVGDGPARSRTIADIAVSIDGLWVGESAPGGATSDIDRYLLDGSTT